MIDAQKFDPVYVINNSSITELCEKYKVNTDIRERWELGIPHHPKSKALVRNISEIDFAFCYDHFCWKYGGDGDNGEALAYSLDIYFDLVDKIEEKGKQNEI